MTMLLDKPASSPPPDHDQLPLENGDHLDRRTFHARYLAMQTEGKAELIGGVAYMPSPAKPRLARPAGKVQFWLQLYETGTPGVEAYDNATVLLLEDGEPQPDACLLISLECGGQTRLEHLPDEEDRESYLAGAPELAAEVASSSASYELHSRKTAYEAAGVREYVVMLVRRPQVRWFVNRDGRFEETTAGEDGVYRSEVFPGLWLDRGALLRLDGVRLRQVLEQGLASGEHRDFVERLSRARADRS